MFAYMTICHRYRATPRPTRVSRPRGVHDESRDARRARAKTVAPSARREWMEAERLLLQLSMEEEIGVIITQCD